MTEITRALNQVERESYSCDAYTRRRTQCTRSPRWLLKDSHRACNQHAKSGPSFYGWVENVCLECGRPW